MDRLILLALALINYYLHDTCQLYIASQLKKRRGAGFPADVTSYFNLQRIGLTLIWGQGWSSEHQFLYTNASEFRWGRWGVMMVHLLSPIIYLVMGLMLMLIVMYVSFIPTVIKGVLFFGSMFNIQMALLMLIPIPPLSMGRILFLYYTKAGCEEKMRQIEFYGTFILVAMIIASLLGYNILPLDAMQNYFMQQISSWLS